MQVLDSDIIDAVDARDEVIGTVKRSEVFTKKVGFRVVHAFVFNPHGALLLQRIAAHRDRHPLQWGSSVAGYVLAGESYDEAIRRKTRLELGLAHLPLQYFGKTQMDDQGTVKFIALYTAEYGGTVDPDPTQIDAVAYVALPTIVEALQTGAMQFTPTFRYLLSYFLAGSPARHDRAV